MHQKSWHSKHQYSALCYISLPIIPVWIATLVRNWGYITVLNKRRELYFLSFFSPSPCSNKLSTSAIQSFIAGVLLSIVNGLCRKFNLSPVMQKIQTLPLSLTVGWWELQDLTSTFKPAHSISHRICISPLDSNVQKDKLAWPTLQHQLPPLDAASGTEAEEGCFVLIPVRERRYQETQM